MKRAEDGRENSSVTRLIGWVWGVLLLLDNLDGL